MAGGEALYERYKDALKRGHVASLRGRLDEALTAYAEASTIAPERPTPHTSAGTALLRRRRPADALRYYEAALTVAPRDETALLGRAQALAALDRRREAADAFDALAEHRVVGGKLADAVDAARRGLELAEGRDRRRTLERLIERLRTSEPGEPGRLALERALRVLEGPAMATAKPAPSVRRTAEDAEAEAMAAAADTAVDAAELAEVWPAASLVGVRPAGEPGTVTPPEPAPEVPEAEAWPAADLAMRRDASRPARRAAATKAGTLPTDEAGDSEAVAAAPGVAESEALLAAPDAARDAEPAAAGVPLAASGAGFEGELEAAAGDSGPERDEPAPEADAVEPVAELAAEPGAEIGAEPEPGVEPEAAAEPEAEPQPVPAIIRAALDRDLPAGVPADELARLAEAALDAGAPDALDRLLDLAAASRDAGRPLAAIDACYLALSQRPDHVGAHLALVQLYDDSGWAALATEKLDLLDRLAALGEDLEGGEHIAAARSARA